MAAKRSVSLGFPISISVDPDSGSTLEIPRLGILTTDEQSKVPLVSNRKTVGIPA